MIGIKNFRTAFMILALSVLVPTQSSAYEGITVSNGGSIKGAVKLRGDVPKLPPLEITKYKDVCKNVPNESLVVGSGKGIRYAVVTLEGISRGKPVEREAVHELDNVRCRFVPHVQAASVGQFLLLKNTDPILHTAHAYFEDQQPHFNVGLYPGRVSRKPLVTPGVVKILCEVHPWMTAFIVITDHPYHAVTDVYGEFLIDNIPPGTYRLKVWHEMLGTQEKEVRVESGKSAQADLIYSAPKGAKK
jgi:plastocyanin